MKVNLCLVHICPGRRAINLSMIFRTILGASKVATGYGVCVHIVYGHCAISSTGPRGQPGVNPYRDSKDIVRKSCNVSAVAMQSPQPPHRNRTEPVRGSAFARCPCRDCAMPLRHVYGIQFFQICKTSR